MKKSPNRLSLHRETLSHLEADLRHIQGGTPMDDYSAWGTCTRYYVCFVDNNTDMCPADTWTRPDI